MAIPFRAFVVVADVAKVVGSSAAVLSVLVLYLGWPASVSRTAMVVLVCLAVGGFLLALLQALGIVRLKCPRCRGGTLSMDWKNGVIRCANCGRSYWKNLVLFGYTVVSQPGPSHST